MFFGRKEQIDRLLALWRKQVPSLVVCRGRRRIGKSTLIREFAHVSGGRFLKFEGLAPDEHMSNRKQLSSFREQLAAQTGAKVPILTDWSTAFRELDKALSGRGRKVVLFDEVSWMGGFDRSFPAKLKMAWDNQFKERSDLIIFVCGSVSMWIHKNILQSKGFVGRIALDLVVPELPIADCVGFWRGKAARISSREILDVLSVTGGIPRYLEEIDPSLSADENIRRICFTPEGYLFREFNELFNDIVSRSAPNKRAILTALAEGPLSGVELAEKISVERNGHLSEILDELETAGFISKANGINPETGRRSRVDGYRLRDNYTRFFLRYVSGRIPEIASGVYGFVSVDLLPGWNAIMGLQFENLVLNNLSVLLDRMGLRGKLVISAAPYRCVRKSRGGGVQIDLLVQTETTAYVVEVKRKNTLGAELIGELKEKALRLPVRPGVSVRTVLVYDGTLTKELASSDEIDLLIPVTSLMSEA